ncbi:hypothetical protein AB0K60_37125 [Thermopolyspora sp. NPDC052614]|uniref:hypothetical protein n=1 Tax=Thermopolyspora sp. NPDC052614 TaxID=3155682 RepID=UPI00343DCB9E
MRLRTLVILIAAALLATVVTCLLVFPLLPADHARPSSVRVDLPATTPTATTADTESIGSETGDESDRDIPRVAPGTRPNGQRVGLPEVVTG